MSVICQNVFYISALDLNVFAVSRNLFVFRQCGFNLFCFIADIPILSVATKSDVLSERQLVAKMERLQEYDLGLKVEEQRQLNRSSRRKRHPTAPETSNTKVIINYCCELEPWSDESVDPSSIAPSPHLDTQLLSLWREIVTRTAASSGSSRKRAFSTTTASRPISRCLPFPFPYSRLRSQSF